VKRRLGAHTSIAGGLHRALERGAAIGCDVIQVFTSSSRAWARRPLTDADLTAWHDARRRTGVEPVMAHGSYLINLAALRAAAWRQASAALGEELGRCAQLGIPYLVLHPGAHMGAGDVAGLKKIAQAIDAVHERRPDCPTTLLIENTAGQGSCLAHSFEHLRDLLGLVRAPQRLGVCLDTQHLHAAGYDIGTQAGWDAAIAAFDRTVGVRWVRAFHVNDSKRPRGARVDRHEHIGRGHLGLEAFRCLLNDPRFAGVPMTIETPKGDTDLEDTVNLGVLRALEGRARVGARARALARQALPPPPARRR
jgi:deoxyribonuclease-4